MGRIRPSRPIYARRIEPRCPFLGAQLVGLPTGLLNQAQLARVDRRTLVGTFEQMADLRQRRKWEDLPWVGCEHLNLPPRPGYLTLRAYLCQGPPLPIPS